MEMLSRAQLEQIAAIVADRSLSHADRESRATAIAGSSVLANRALDWLPEAFGLLALSQIPDFVPPTTFSAIDQDGAWHQFPFSAEPLFDLSIELARSTCNHLIRPIGEQSSCVNAVDQALNAGHSLKGATISGPALVSVLAETYFPGQASRTARVGV